VDSRAKERRPRRGAKRCCYQQPVESVGAAKQAESSSAAGREAQSLVSAPAPSRGCGERQGGFDFWAKRRFRFAVFSGTLCPTWKLLLTRRVTPQGRCTPAAAESSSLNGCRSFYLPAAECPSLFRGYSYHQYRRYELSPAPG
jgi:hypothetical protein